MRKIIHIDMDAFYASVEQRDRPELQGHPIAVGGSPSGRGVVMTASYEARKFGVRSAMPSARAITLCPQLIFVRPRFEAYKEASHHIREIFSRYTDLIEPLSLDEAYLDVTHNKKEIASALRIAQLIKDEIWNELQLTASAGVSFGKFLAKMASGYRKPNGLNFISPESAPQFLDQLPIEKFHGIGEKTAEKMRRFGIHNGADLREADPRFLVKRFGKAGRFYHRIAQGKDERPVRPGRPRKSASVEDTFREDILDLAELDAHLDRLSEVLIGRLSTKKLFGKTVNLKVKYGDFQIVTRSKSYPQAVREARLIAASGKEMLRNTEAGHRPVRLLGIGLSNFEGMPRESKHGQLELDLWGEEE